MKKLISQFSDRLLSKEQLKTVKGGTQYCTCDGTLQPLTWPTCEQQCSAGGGGYGELCQQPNPPFGC